MLTAPAAAAAEAAVQLAPAAAAARAKILKSRGALYRIVPLDIAEQVFQLSARHNSPKCGS